MKKLLLAFLFLAWTVPAFSQEGDRGESTEVVSSETLALLCVDQVDNHIRLIQGDTILWSYPDESEGRFKYMPTDAKRVEVDGEVFVLVAFHGRVQMVRFRDHKVMKNYPTYKSCHSAELLPDGALVTASSNHGKLRVHHSEEIFHDLDLPYAHGVVWDKARNRLWALGDSLYRLEYTDGKLTVEKKFTLPKSPTGHDLFPFRDEATLLVSNNDELYSFDVETERFEAVSELPFIKSVSQHIDGSIWATERVVIEGAKRWHTDAVHQVQPVEPERRIVVPGAWFYKARWWQEAHLSR